MAKNTPSNQGDNGESRALPKAQQKKLLVAALTARDDVLAFEEAMKEELAKLRESYSDAVKAFSESRGDDTGRITIKHGGQDLLFTIGHKGEQFFFKFPKTDVGVTSF